MNTGPWTAVMRSAALSLLLAASAPALSAPTPSGAAFHYDADSVATASYWAAISNLANAIMFSGLGEPQSISMADRFIPLTIPDTALTTMEMS